MEHRSSPRLGHDIGVQRKDTNMAFGSKKEHATGKFKRLYSSTMDHFELKVRTNSTVV